VSCSGVDYYNNKIQNEINDHISGKGLPLRKEEIIQGQHGRDKNNIGDELKHEQAFHGVVGSEEVRVSSSCQNPQIDEERRIEDDKRRNHQADPNQNEPSGETFQILVEREGRPGGRRLWRSNGQSDWGRDCAPRGFGIFHCRLSGGLAARRANRAGRREFRCALRALHGDSPGPGVFEEVCATRDGLSKKRDFNPKGFRVGARF
jgi:hypothetical protein